MLLYERSSLKVAELFFDEPAGRIPADIIRYHHRSTPLAEGPVADLQTLWIDLTADADSLLAGMNKVTRYEIRRAAKEGATYESQSWPDAVWMQEFFAFYDRFATGKGLPRANRTRLTAMLQNGVLDLSRMRGQDGETMVWHAHLRGDNRVRLLHSASIFREMDKEAANLTGRANRLHHWADMQRFRDEGIATFDFGGWYAGADDTAKLRINEFKRGFGGTVVPQYNADRPVTWKGAAALSLRLALRTWRGQEE